MYIKVIQIIFIKASGEVGVVVVVAVRSISSRGCVSFDSQNVDGKPAPKESLLFCQPSKHIIAPEPGARISRRRTAWHHNDDGSFIDTWVGLELTASSR